MHTLEQLRSGELRGVTKLSLSCDLIEFPREIFDLSEKLEILDLSSNRLDKLPDDFYRLKKLRILFLAQNNFTEIPKVLSKCKSIAMIGLKSNRISTWGEDALPIGIRWLVLTDNQIETIPNSIGRLNNLQKLMLAGNRVNTLPENMQNCKNLELIRLSANQLKEIPKWIFGMSKLSWLALANNPCIKSEHYSHNNLENIEWSELKIEEKLGEGASGIISRSIFDSRSMALKVFKGSITSDGYPHDEMIASIRAGDHKNLNRPYGKISNHPKGREALLFPLIPMRYHNLSNPPSLESCTRDIYDKKTSFLVSQILKIAYGISSAMRHLHETNINHGDLYAHNILIDEEGHSILGDFGAATIYDRSCKKLGFELLEVRAFGLLIDELLERSVSTSKVEESIIDSLVKIKVECLSDNVAYRPTFDDIYRSIIDI